MHPYLSQPDLMAFCQKNNVHGRLSLHWIIVYTNWSYYSNCLLSSGKYRFTCDARTSCGKVSLYFSLAIISTDCFLQLDIAKKHNASPAQVLLAWGLQRGCSVIPKSVTPSRIISNFQVIQLDQAEFASLEELTKNKQGKRLLDPSPFWGVDIYKSKL